MVVNEFVNEKDKFHKTARSFVYCSIWAHDTKTICWFPILKRKIFGLHYMLEATLTCAVIKRRLSLSPQIQSDIADIFCALQYKRLYWAYC